MKKTLLSIVLSCFFVQVYSQNLVEATLLETRSQEQLNLIFTLIGATANNGGDAYKILYETADTDGTIDTASGLVILPILDNSIPKPFLTYQHGTSSDRDNVPSRLPQEALLVYFFAAQGYISMAPDYLGLGDSRRAIHPYVHADTEASAGIDLLRATQQFLDAEGVAYNDQLFLTGYSQGGHASMAMHKEIETNLSEEFTVTAASHMSGPYNLSADVIGSTGTDRVYDFPSYVVWLFVGYQSVSGDLYTDLSTVFQPEYIEVVEQFENGTITRGELNTLLVDQLTAAHGASFPNRMFTESFLNDLKTDPTNPARLALQDNDVFGWVPTTPTQLLYCMSDEQVVFTNATFTDSIMNANGAPSVTSIDINSEFNHGECVIPATANTAEFFAQFLEGNVTSTINVDPSLAFKISPNPATQYIQIAFPQSLTAITNIQVINLQGQLIQEQVVDVPSTVAIDMSNQPNGLYVVRVKSENGFWVEKVMVGK